MRSAPLPMLLTHPESKLEYPPEMAPSQGGLWRAVEALGTGLFVVLLRSKTFEADEPRLLVMAWDSDLVHFVESPRMEAELCALHHFMVLRGWHGPRTLVREVRELWRGTDAESPGSEVIIFKAYDGTSFCGSGAIPVPPSVREVALIATVGSRFGR